MCDYIHSVSQNSSSIVSTVTSPEHPGTLDATDVIDLQSELQSHFNVSASLSRVRITTDGR